MDGSRRMLSRLELHGLAEIQTEEEGGIWRILLTPMKCHHKYEVTGTEDGPNRRWYFLSCKTCHKSSRRSRKLVRAQFDSPKPKTHQKPTVRQRKAIPRMSEDKKVWDSLYKAKLQSDPEVVTGYDLWWAGPKPIIVKVHGPKNSLQRHHVGRRWKWLILWYRYVTEELHTWIEHNSATAREMGLLFNVERGQLRNPSEHDPLNCLEEFYRLQKQFNKAL